MRIGMRDRWCRSLSRNVSRVGLKEQLQRLVSHVLCSLGEYLGVEACLLMTRVYFVAYGICTRVLTRASTPHYTTKPPIASKQQHPTLHTPTFTIPQHHKPHTTRYQRQAIHTPQPLITESQYTRFGISLLKKNYLLA